MERCGTHRGARLEGVKTSVHPTTDHELPASQGGPTRIAAIDIGSNSVRSIIVDVPPQGDPVLLDDEKAYTRLGKGLHSTGRLSEKAMEETVGALTRMLKIIETFDVERVRAIATAAVRRAENSADLLDRIQDELGLEVETVPEEEEGRLAFVSAAGTLQLDGRTAVIDIGGGSVEIVRATDREIESIASLPIGAVVMSERYHRKDPIPKKEYKRLKKHVRKTLAGALGEDPDPVHTVVASGGTANALATVIASAEHSSPTTVHGYELTRADLVHTLAFLSRSTAAERAAMKGLPESRIDIILAGTVVLHETMKALGANTMLVNAKGVREGLVLEMVAEQRGGRSSPMDRMEAAERFGERCGYDARHAKKVRDLTLSIFDQLLDETQLTEEDRPLLEAAALLHDVGYHISYEKHHKHSHHLIVYSDLPGFTARERRIIAAVARYHRGALPKPKHEAMQNLDRSDRERVIRLGGILRLADGLDRTRSGRIESVSITVRHDVVFMHLLGTGDLSVEIHGAEKKAGLFERAFGVHVQASAEPTR